MVTSGIIGQSRPLIIRAQPKGSRIADEMQQYQCYELSHTVSVCYKQCERTICTQEKRDWLSYLLICNFSSRVICALCFFFLIVYCFFDVHILYYIYVYVCMYMSILYIYLDGEFICSAKLQNGRTNLNQTFCGDSDYPRREFRLKRFRLQPKRSEKSSFLVSSEIRSPLLCVTEA